MIIIEEKKIKNILLSKKKSNKLQKKKNALLDFDNNNTINNVKPKTQNLFFRILFILGNLKFLIINIYFLKKKHINFFSNKENKRNKIYFRNNDKIFINYFSNSYENIGNFLNEKYNNFSDIIIPTKNNEKKLIRLFAVNLCSGEEIFKQTLLWYLKDKYIIEFDKENPDYHICEKRETHTFLDKNFPNLPKYSEELE